MVYYWIVYLSNFFLFFCFTSKPKLYVLLFPEKSAEQENSAKRRSDGMGTARKINKRKEIVTKEIFTKKTLLILVVIGLFLALLTLLFQFSFGDYSGAAVQSAEEQDTDVVTGEVHFTVKEKPVTEEGQVVFNVVKR